MSNSPEHQLHSSRAVNINTKDSIQVVAVFTHIPTEPLGKISLFTDYWVLKKNFGYIKYQLLESSVSLHELSNTYA